MDLLGRPGAAAARALDVATLRHEVIATNIANADTPGYKAKVVRFDDVLRETVISEREGTVQRQDGNNVVMELEHADLWKNQLFYRVFLQSLAHRVRTLRSAIAGRSS